MPDYGGPLEFGVGVEPLADPSDFAARVAGAADGDGLDLVGIRDHPYQRWFLDTWTLTRSGFALERAWTRSSSGPVGTTSGGRRSSPGRSGRP